MILVFVGLTYPDAPVPVAPASADVEFAKWKPLLCVKGRRALVDVEVEVLATVW